MPKYFHYYLLPSVLFNWPIFPRTTPS